MNLPSTNELVPSPPPTTPELDVASSAGWTVRQMIAGAFTVLAVALIFLVIYRFYMVVFLFFVAFSLTVALDPILTRLRRWGLRKEIGVILIFVLLLLATTALVVLLAPVLIEQTRTVIADLPTYYDALRTYLLDSRLGLVRGFARTLPGELSLPQLAAFSSSAPTESATLTWTYGNAALRTLFAIIGVFIMAFYWTLEGELITRKLLLLAPVERREELRELIGEINTKIGGYARGQLILCVIVGGLSLVTFLLLGIPNAIILGVLMGIFEAIPVLGPTLGAIPAVLMTLATAPDKALFVVLALVGIQVLENNLLVPRIMDESVGVNAVVSMVAIAAFAALFGIAGAILAIPLAAILQIMLNRLLFAAPVVEENAPGGNLTAQVSRGQLSVIRLEARDLATAVRNATRSEESANDHEQADEVADEIEAIATGLDQYLASVEERA